MGLKCMFTGHSYIYQGLMSANSCIYRCYSCNHCNHQKIVEVDHNEAKSRWY